MFCYLIEVVPVSEVRLMFGCVYFIRVAIIIAIIEVLVLVVEIVVVMMPEAWRVAFALDVSVFKRCACARCTNRHALSGSSDCEKLRRRAVYVMSRFSQALNNEIRQRQFWIVLDFLLSYALSISFLMHWYNTCIHVMGTINEVFLHMRLILIIIFHISTS